MTTSLVLTLIGDDRPGLVEAVSTTIAEHGANWLESRMARLGGKFAGILLVEAPLTRSAELSRALAALAADGLQVVVEETRGDSPLTPADEGRILELELIGQDRPGIVRDIARALAERGVNVLELTTGCVSAPMSGEALFQASARLEVPPTVEVAALRSLIEDLANDLMVDITLGPPTASTTATA
jgi:glycine cleavage system regulatory protein